MLAEVKMGSLLKEYLPESVSGPVTTLIVYSAQDSSHANGILDCVNGTLTNTPDSVIEHLEELGENLGKASRCLDIEYYQDRLWEMEWTGFCFIHHPTSSHHHPIIRVTSNDCSVDRGIWKQVTTREAIEAINSIIEDPTIV